ncbi:MAG: hypothetical protein GY859_12725 [Desulfobacterales bacterium]|nr:hypothetical protein [Desulfobacterales bacterium]
MKKENTERSLFNGVLTAHFIIILHIILIGGVGLLVLFFAGIAKYMTWIFLGGLAALLGAGYYLYRRMKAQGKTLKEMMRSPMFRGREVEVSFLGGLASVKVGQGNGNGQPLLDSDTAGPANQLEDPETVRIRELTELARLLENDLVTLDEFNKAKKLLFRDG